MPSLSLDIRYTGQTIDELLALEPTHHPIPLAGALVDAIEHAARARERTPAEETVLAASAVENEVNTGGFHLFFVGSTRRWAPVAARSLRELGCYAKSGFAQEAIDALNLPDPNAPTPDAIAKIILDRDADFRLTFYHADRGYHWVEEDVPVAIIRFIKANRAQFPA